MRKLIYILFVKQNYSYILAPWRCLGKSIFLIFLLTWSFFSFFLHCSMSIFRLVSKIGAIFLIRLLYSNSKAKQNFRFGALSQNPSVLLQLQTYALFPPWCNFSISTRFAPTTDLCSLSALVQLLHIYPFCSNSPCPLLQKSKNPWRLPRGFVYSLKTDISSASYLFYLLFFL